MRSLSEHPELVYFLAVVLVANGITIAGWMLFIRGRSHGNRRCPRCWYSMAGSISDEGRGFKCPECGRCIRRERGLFRTRRHWRRALPGLVLIVAGAALAAGFAQRHSNPWRLAPDIVIIDAIPRMRSSGRLVQEFYNRKFLGQSRAALLAMAGFGPFDLDSYRLRQLRGFERWLLARRAAEALERKPRHHLTYDLLIILALTGEQRERAFVIAKSELSSSSGYAHVSVAVIERVAPSKDAAAEVFAARLRALVAADPTLQDVQSREGAVAIVAALGRLGDAGKIAVPALISIIPVHSPSRFARFIPVIQALGRIGPAAAEALPAIEASADLSDEQSGDWIDAAVAKLLIEGKCASEEEAFGHMLRHSNWRARRAAATHLQDLSTIGQAGEASLLAAIDDPNEWVRWSVEAALRKHGVESAPALESKGTPRR
jgi:hypothetical protein